MIFSILIVLDLFDFRITKITDSNNLKFIVPILYFITYIAELKAELKHTKLELNKIKTIYKHHD